MAFNLPVTERPKRVVRSFSLQPANLETVERLAHLKHTTASRIVDTLIEHFGSKVLEQMDKETP